MEKEASRKTSGREPAMTHLICIETATEICSVALSADNNCLCCLEDMEGNSHAEKIMLLIDHCLQQSGIKIEELNAVCISSGPGSYTGLRIGTSTAKGICYALGIPLIAVSSLKGIACGAAKEYPEFQLFCPMIDARRMEVYCALYDPHGNTIQDIHNEIITESSFEKELANAPVIFCGNGAEKCKPLLSTNPNSVFARTLSSAKNLIAPAFQAWEAKQFENTAYFEPFYLKEFKAGAPHVKGL